MFGRCTKANPVITKAAPNAGRDHGLEHATTRLVADTVAQVATGAHILDRGQVATLVVDRRESVTDKLFRDVRHAVALASLPLRCAVFRSPSGHFQNIHCIVCHAAIELAICILVERAAGWGHRSLGDIGHRKRLAVVEPRVTAAVVHTHRVLGTHLIQVAYRQRPLVLELGVVVEVAVYPSTGRCGTRLVTQFGDDAVDGDEFHLERVSHEHFVQERGTPRVIVRIDEARHDGHSLRVDQLRAFARERPHFR